MNKFIKKIKNNQALYILSILIIGILLLLIARITYAYLAPRIQSALSNITTISDTVDDFKLELGRPLSLNATSTTLPENGSNLVVTSTEIAKLKANSTKKTANYNYYLYLQITNNTFKYSDGTTPEIILTITDPNGNEVTSLDNLTYGTYNGVSGFDVTTKTGLFAIANNYEITSNSSTTYTEHDWNITLTYLNLNIDQSGNYGNSFETKLYLQKEEKVLRFDETCNDDSISCHIAKLYTGTQGENNIYYHDSKLTNGAEDNSYRYAGASADVKNYICLGSSEATCPDDNLYRIMGVFGDNNHGVKDQQLVKVIKNTSIGNIAWNTTASNDWANASLNTTLNSTFKTEKLSGFENKIEEVTWRVSGYSTSGATAKTVYTGEITNATKTHTAKIGLMYASDYGYATTPDYWAKNFPEYSIAAWNKDWLFLGSQEWLLSPYSSNSNYAWIVYSSGNVHDDGNVTNTNAVRPSFFLTSSVQYVSGSGTSTDPIRIN